MAYDLLTEYDKITTGSKITDKKNGKEYIVLERDGRRITLKDLSSGKEIPMSTSRLAITLGRCDIEDILNEKQEEGTE